MSLNKKAQELIVVDPSMSDMNDMDSPHMTLVPLEVSDETMSSEHDHDHQLEIIDPGEIEIVIGDLPGAPAGTHDPIEEMLEVSEEDSKDKSDADPEGKKNKKNEKWDWESHGAQGFVAWIKARIDDIPKHSGYDSAGLERAVSYLERLDNEISRAMRLDLDGELDANKVEAVRAEIDDGLARLNDRIDKVKKNSKNRRKKKAEVDSTIVKEAQKITGVQGVYITVPLLISRIARVCINGMVSAGHDIEDLYSKQVKKYKLNDREQAEVMQLLADMGYAMRRDRGYLIDEEQSDEENMDFATNYKG